MYFDIVKYLELNSDELDLLVEILENYDYSSTAERLVVTGLIDKLNEE